MLQKIFENAFGSYNDRQIKKLRENFVPKINALEKEFQALSMQEIQEKFSHWKKVLTQNPKKVDAYLIPVYAGIKNAARRLLGKTYTVKGKTTQWDMVHFDVQIIGGVVLHKGNVAEMKTGEGKTLVCTLPVILNALTGKGTHIITVNDYLAARDSEWMKPLYEFCGLSVGCVVHDISAEERQKAYQCDITYGTNNEFGFDYLRDNMAQRQEDLVQRELHFAIVDEVDSILIDEARTPLIISAPEEESTEKYIVYSRLVPRLKENEDYNVDIRTKTVSLTEAGIGKIEKWTGVSHLFTEKGFEEVHHVEQSLKAHVIFEKDKDYVVRDGEVLIVDEFTGRLMPGRRYSDGLHQALEAKENVQINRESKTLATITFQNYFRLYQKLAGMTGTAETEAEEFAKIYKLDTLVIPTNKPISRRDLTDKIFKTERGKFIALAREIKEIHQQGQPVLVGTVSIEKSEALSALLKKEGVPHEILNAKHHEREAEIVANAGQKGAVTIATNMAGRGTDIKINEAVKALGGLAVLGTERHESRRIDNQLRGRAGRQGDPGFTQFYIAMNDELVRRFGGTAFIKIMNMLGIAEDEAIQDKRISKTVESAQKKIESFHFDSRKHVVQYDDVMNKHRERIYTRRKNILFAKDISSCVSEIFQNFAQSLVEQHFFAPKIQEEDENLDEIFETIQAFVKIPDNFRAEIENFSERSELAEFLAEFLEKQWQIKRATFPEGMEEQVIRYILLKSIDEHWLEHINSMTNLRDRVSLSGYAQKDPILEYKREAFEMFKQLLFEVRLTCVGNIFRAKISPAFSAEYANYADANTNEGAIEGNLHGGREQISAKNTQGLSRAERRRMEKQQKKQK